MVKKMNIYLAGPCDTDNRSLMMQIAQLIENDGRFSLYCPWKYKVQDAWSYSQEDWAMFVFERDVRMIDECDLFLMVSKGRHSTAGTNWEQGYAYAKGKKVYVIQVTNDQTSLMTFHGSHLFLNANKQSLINDIRYMLDMALYPADEVVHGDCETVLT